MSYSNYGYRTTREKVKSSHSHVTLTVSSSARLGFMFDGYKIRDAKHR